MRIRLFSLVVAIILAGVFPAVAAVQAVVTEFSGKAEVKPAGGGWKPVTVNMVVPAGATVSTGFNSRMVLTLGATKINVAPLTRMILEELVMKEQTQATTVNLKVGKVNVDVKSSSGERSDFKLKGPVSTAAVRGTRFDYDGYELVVQEGIVQFANLLNQNRSVQAGAVSKTTGYSRPTSEEVVKQITTFVASEAGGLPVDETAAVQQPTEPTTKKGNAGGITLTWK